LILKGEFKMKNRDINIYKNFTREINLKTQVINKSKYQKFDKFELLNEIEFLNDDFELDETDEIDYNELDKTN
jgi:hypothetical protein